MRILEKIIKVEIMIMKKQVIPPDILNWGFNTLLLLITYNSKNIHILFDPPCPHLPPWLSSPRWRQAARCWCWPLPSSAAPPVAPPETRCFCLRVCRLIQQLWVITKPLHAEHRNSFFSLVLNSIKIPTFENPSTSRSNNHLWLVPTHSMYLCIFYFLFFG